MFSVFQYISLDAGSLFADAGVTKEDLKDFTDKLSRAQDSLLKATDFMKTANNKTSKKLQEIMDEMFNLPQAQTGTSLYISIIGDTSSSDAVIVLCLSVQNHFQPVSLIF